jgi:hypothetical protein
MSNPILQSNQSSAVVATVNESQTMSPWVYNETNRLVVPHAMQVLPINHSSGTVGVSKTISFDIAKNGLVQGLWLKVVLPSDHTAPAETDAPVQTETAGGDSGGSLTGQVNNRGFTAMGLLKLIQEIRLTTSGRIVESLDKYQILARIADLPLGQRQAVLNAYRCNGDPELGEENTSYEACLWLPFYFSKDSARYHINSNFAEPFQVQVQFSACDDVLYDSGSAFTVHAPTDADLLVHYRQLDEKTINDVISKNYGDGLLSQIVHISKKEALRTTAVVGPITAVNRKHTKLQTVEFEMKENDAIESMYIMVESDKAPTNFAAGQLDNCPIEIMEVELKFNNTSVLKVPGEFLRYFGRWGMHGMCGDGSDSATGLSPTRYVYKIDFGLDYTKGAFSNIVALREVSNPKCIIKFAPYVQTGSDTSTTYNVHIVYDTATFLSTSSATGRVNLSISS